MFRSRRISWLVSLIPEQGTSRESYLTFSGRALLCLITPKQILRIGDANPPMRMAKVSFGGIVEEINPIESLYLQEADELGEPEDETTGLHNN